MTISLCSVPKRPSAGGIATLSAFLAGRLFRAGHRVMLVTQCESVDAEAEAFQVDRRTSALRLLSHVRWADVLFHNRLSLRLA